MSSCLSSIVAGVEHDTFDVLERCLKSNDSSRWRCQNLTSCATILHRVQVFIAMLNITYQKIVQRLNDHGFQSLTSTSFPIYIRILTWRDQTSPRCWFPHSIFESCTLARSHLNQCHDILLRLVMLGQLWKAIWKVSRLMLDSLSSGASQDMIPSNGELRYRSGLRSFYP